VLAGNCVPGAYAPYSPLPATPVSLPLTNNQNTNTINKQSRHVLPMS
jgi:hypothetical protein